MGMLGSRTGALIEVFQPIRRTNLDYNLALAVELVQEAEGLEPCYNHPQTLANIKPSLF